MVNFKALVDPTGYCIYCGDKKTVCHTCPTASGNISIFTDYKEPEPQTPRDSLLKLHSILTSEAKELMIAKNNDYSTESDPLKNFRRHGAYGILVRLSDKLARLENYVERGYLKVKDESARDSILDLINYAVLLQAMFDGIGGQP